MISPRKLLAGCLAGALILGALGAMAGITRAASDFGTAQGSGPDLVVSQQGPATALPGSRLTYTLRVTNTGNITAQGAVLVDTPGLGLRINGASPSPLVTGSAWSWALGDLGPGTAAEVAVDLAVSPSLAAGLVLSNTASVTEALGAELTPADNQNQRELTVVRADLVLGQVVPAKVALGGHLNYQWIVTNSGGADSTNVYLTASIGTAVLPESATSGLVILGGGFVRWPLGTVAAGESRPITLTALVPISATEGSFVVVTGQTAGETVESASGNNSTVALVQVTTTDLATSMALAPIEVQAGDLVTATVVLANGSPAAAEGVKLHVGWPPELAYVDDALDSPRPGATRTISADGEAWDLGLLPAAGTARLTLTLRVAGAVNLGSQLTVAAAATSTTLDPLLANSSAARNAVVVAPNLWVTKLAPRVAAPGEVIDYSLFFGNSGSVPARNARLTDTLPTGLTFLSATLPAAITDNTLGFGLGTVPAGAGDSLHVYARVDAGLGIGLTLTNQAAIAAGPQDAAPGDNASQADTQLAPAAPASLTLTAPSVLATGGATAPITVSVGDAFGNRISNGTPVQLATSLGAFVPASVTLLSLLTIGGEVSATLASSAGSGTARLTATVGSISTTAQVRFPAGPPARLSLRTDPMSPTVGTTATLIAELRDANGNAVDDGLVIDLASSAGRLTMVQPATQGGLARALLYSTQSGPIQITATLGALTQTQPLAFVADLADRVGLSTDGVNIAVGDGTVVASARVLDRFDNPVRDGTLVSFSSPGGRFSPNVAPTAAGVATSTFKAGAVPGVFALSAVVGLVSSQLLVELQPTNLQLNAELKNERGRTIDTQTYPNEVVTYSLGIKNSGLAIAHSTLLGVALPKGFGDFSVISPTHQITGGLRLPASLISLPGEGTATAFQLGDVESGEQLTLTMVGRMLETNAWTGFDTLFFQAALTTTTPEATPVDLSRASTAKVYAADLYLGTTLEATSAVRPGGWLNFNISYGNNQPQTTVNGASITVSLPSELHFDGWSPLPGATLELSPNGQELVWAVVGNLQNSQGFKLRLAIDPGAAPASVIVMTATIGSPVYDLRPSNNHIEDSQVRLRGVNLVTTIEAPGAASAGDVLRLRVRTENASERDAASNIVTRARLPVDWLVQETSPEAIHDSPSDLRWLLDSAQAGGGATYEVVAKVPETATLGAVYDMDAQSTSDGPESFAADNYASRSLRIVPGPARTLTLSAVPDKLVACNRPTGTLIAVLEDRHGLPVADGTAVRWLANGATLALSETRTTDGHATNVLTAGDKPGTVDIAAVTGDGAQAVQASTTVTLTAGPPAALILSANPQYPVWKGSSQVAALVRDACSRPVEDGWPVVLSAERGTWEGAGGPEITVRSVDGRVAARLNVGEAPGPLKVTARHGTVVAETQISVGSPPSPTPEPTATPLPPKWEIYAPYAAKHVALGRR